MQPPRARRGCVKKRSTGARSTTRPWCRKITSSPRRRAWPRLCVDITILVPDASKRLDHGLDLARRAGIEVRRRLVEEQHLRMQRPGARQRQALLLAAGEHARRAMRDMSQADLAPAPPLRSAPGLQHAARVPVRRPHWPAPSGAASPAAGTPWPAACARPPPAPRDPAGGGLEQAVHEAHQHALSRAVGAEDDGAADRLRSRATRRR